MHLYIEDRGLFLLALVTLMAVGAAIVAKLDSAVPSVSEDCPGASTPAPAQTTWSPAALAVRFAEPAPASPRIVL